MPRSRNETDGGLPLRLATQAFSKKPLNEGPLYFPRPLDRRAGTLQRRVHGVEEAGDGGLLVKRWERAADCIGVSP
jgi:hypothetical protein